MHVVAAEPLAAAQERQLDQERAADDLAAELLDQLAQRARRAAGRQQVVVDEHARAACERVGVQLERVDAVLEQVLGADRLVRQLARLAGQHEAGAELARERRPEQEAARLGADDDVDAQRRARSSASPRPPRRAPAGSASSGVMSLKTIPGFGKSGMSRISPAQVGGRDHADDLAQVADRAAGA